MNQWRKIISFDFHHIPKLSIGFKQNLKMTVFQEMTLESNYPTKFDDLGAILLVGRCFIWWNQHMQQLCIAN